MLRTVIIAAVTGVAGYVLGVRAGFDVGVRDYVENGSEWLDRVATKKEKFDYPRDVNLDGEAVEAAQREQTKRRGFQ